jgi:oxygen-independent coproporphyrinogen-3 oxidase
MVKFILIMKGIYSLYVHFPFCKTKCDYCAFYSLPMNTAQENLMQNRYNIREYESDVIDIYIHTVLADIKNQIDVFDVEYISTIYIGGGTPSVMSIGQAKRLISGLAAMLAKPPLEWTIEVNPESLEADFLKVCSDYGVSRISAGVQTFNEKARRSVRRAGDVSVIKKNLEYAAFVYAGALSVDVISGLPESNVQSLLQDIDDVIRIGSSHVSLYDLSVEDGTALAERVVKKNIHIPDDDLSAEMWIAGRDALVNAGYRHYEVSNFAVCGCECLHNIAYWQMRGWLGVGAGASGTIIQGAEGLRYSGPPDLAAYLKAAANAPCVFSGGLRDEWLDTAGFYTHETLDRKTLLKETLLMGFRYTEGPDAGLFYRRFSRSIEAALPYSLAAWRARGLARPDRAALTSAGMLFLNGFLRDCFAEIDSL